MTTLLRWAPSLAALSLIAYFAAHAMTGSQGVLAWVGYKRDIARLESQLADLRADRSTMESRAARLREESLDLDFLDERARALAGVAHPHDVIIPAAALPATLRVPSVDAAGRAP